MEEFWQQNYSVQGWKISAIQALHYDQHRTLQKFTYTNNKSTSEVMLIKKSTMGCRTYTAIVERVTKLLTVLLDKKGFGAEFRSPQCYCTHTHEHTEPHEIVWCHIHMCTQNFSNGEGGDYASLYIVSLILKNVL
jgi:hypothetical protein